jgi:hypothetical protein
VTDPIVGAARGGDKEAQSRLFDLCRDVLRKYLDRQTDRQRRRPPLRGPSQRSL